ncbi:MAG: hemerythrin domain-containing protein [Burkholderiales bacterium]|nr:hemerythrin domain-containing protein [Burkholderiales bacterium]
MSGQIAAWHAEHLNFARLLRLLEGEVARFAAGETPDYDLMRDIVYYLLHFPDVHHHRYENEVFTRVAARDHALKPLVTRLLQEHRVIAASGERLHALIEAVVGGALATRAELEAAAATYLVYYRAHLAAEEGKMLPRVAEMMSASDWAAVAAAVAEHSRGDPLFGPAAEARFRGLRLAIEREAAALAR